MADPTPTNPAGVAIDVAREKARGEGFDEALRSLRGSLVNEEARHGIHHGWALILLDELRTRGPGKP